MNYESMLDDLRSWDKLFGGGIPTKAEIEAAMRGEIDPDDHKGMVAYNGPLDRQIISYESAAVYPGCWSLAQFKKLMTDIMDAVPVEYRDSAIVELKDESTELIIKYDRPQTDEEWGIMLARAIMNVRVRKAKEKETYIRLVKKYGP